MNIIDIHKLCFKYDAREVLHDINLAIEPGMFAAMVGPNGGGKTTLLKLILGLLQPRYGSVTVFGKTPEQARRAIGYVPQAIHVDPAFPATVLDIVLMGRLDRHLCGPYRRQDRDIARKCLANVQLDKLADRPFAQLSGGERQRVLIAQALATEPKLLLLDEPCANLDPLSSRLLFQLLKTLNRELTILMVSHNLEIIANVVSHVICINHTASMHDINAMPTHRITDMWLHLTHDTCPISNAYAQEPQNFHPDD